MDNRQSDWGVNERYYLQAVLKGWRNSMLFTLVLLCWMV